MLTHYGALDYDFSTLVEKVKTIKDWVYRSDVESYTTCKLCPND